MAEFGTSGLRGLASDLLAGTALDHARAFGRLLRHNGARTGDTLFTGSDLRESSPALVAECSAGLAEAELNPVYCGSLPTPALALHAIRHGAPSLMVTGSHIPADRNGIKFYSSTGEIDKNDEAAIAAYVTGHHERESKHDPVPIDPGAREEALDGYRSRYYGLFPAGFLSGRRIGVFEHSSVARELLGEAVEHYGGELVRLGRTETFIPIDTEALEPEVMNRLQNWIVEHRLDAIISTDADADRPLVMDEQGFQVRGDCLGLATAIMLDADIVVTPVTSNSALENQARFEIERTRVGSPFVLAAMAEAAGSKHGVICGFEANGGFLLGTEARIGDRVVVPLPTRDAMLPILSVLAQAASNEQTLSAYVAGLKLNQTCSGRLKDFSRERSRNLIKWLGVSSHNANRFLEGMGTVHSTDDIDGLKLHLEGGETVHVRASGNAPEIRCYAEAGTKERAEFLVETGLSRMASMQFELKETGA